MPKALLITDIKQSMWTNEASNQIICEFVLWKIQTIDVPTWTSIFGIGFYHLGNFYLDNCSPY